MDDEKRTMTEEEREQKIQEALKNAEAKWDEKYSQDDWPTPYIPDENAPAPKPDRMRRAGKGFASKALRNLY